MATIRPFSLFDLLKNNNILFDTLTENYSAKKTADWLIRWPKC